MADPFSIIAGSASLLDISWRVISYISRIQEAAARVEDELSALSKEIESLVSVNSSLEDVWTSEQKAFLATSVTDTVRIDSLWRNVGTNLRDCRLVLEKLDDLLKAVHGKAGPLSPGKLDNLIKQLRRESRDDDFRQLRDRLTTHQNSLQMLLTALNMYDHESQHQSHLDHH
jgi:DNA-binding transcriptional MerR regulator